MSAPEWKPGDVAESMYRGVKSRALVVEGRSCPREHPRNSPHWHGMTGGWNLLDDDAVTYRPLVVLDLDDAPEMASPLLAATCLDAAAEIVKESTAPRKTREPVFLTWLADQIEAQTKPPKPAEPTGLGAVVEDADGERWVLYTYTGDTAPWTDGSASCEWDDINAVRVLSEGVS